MTVAEVRTAYGRWATAYTEKVGAVGDADPGDVDVITDWAAALDGPVIDAGCGPGQWTEHLAAAGLAIEGVDLTPEFVAIARERFPRRDFRVGRLESLEVPDGSLAGVLAWYSLIHTAPAEVEAILGEFARCTRTGGELLLGFFRGAAVEPFDHTVVTAYYWPVPTMIEALETAGFEVVQTWSRDHPGRDHAAIRARRGRP